MLCCCTKAVPVVETGTHLAVAERKADRSLGPKDQGANSAFPTSASEGWQSAASAQPSEDRALCVHSIASISNVSASGGPEQRSNPGQGSGASSARPNGYKRITTAPHLLPPIRRCSAPHERNQEGGRETFKVWTKVASFTGASARNLLAFGKSWRSRKPGDRGEAVDEAPLWPAKLSKVAPTNKMEATKRDAMQPLLVEQYRSNKERILEMSRSDAPVLYVIGQVSTAELEHYCVKHRGAIVLIQGLTGFNVVDLDSGGDLTETERSTVQKICDDNSCVLLNLTSHDCLKVGFNQLYELFDTSIPDCPQKEVLFTYRSSSFGSFAASVSRGKIKVTEEDGAATDGLIRSVDVTIGESVDKLRSFELQLYQDAMNLCKNDPDKQAIFRAVMEAVRRTDVTTPEDYLVARTQGFGVPNSFVEMRNKCAAEITQAAYQTGGVLNGCMTPVYDDWSVHQAMRILAGMEPLDKEEQSNVDRHLAFTGDCLKYIFGLLKTPSPYSVEIFDNISKSNHIVLHDIGSDTGPDDYPACVMLMALVKFKRGSTTLKLLSVGGEPKYRALRNSLMQHLVPSVEGVEILEGPFFKGISFPSPFVPVALVQTMENLESQTIPCLSI
mmetsp:Transcript_19024/g.53031  ORF Transcript_19024/g.53031 Transcript_19024/m.53031 type:complete len:614 (-) Transcript_19024:165-2006(-)